MIKSVNIDETKNLSLVNILNQYPGVIEDKAITLPPILLLPWELKIPHLNEKNNKNSKKLSKLLTITKT